MRPPNSQLLVLACIFIVFHLIAISSFSIENSRWVRVLTSAVFLGIYFPQIIKRNIFLAGALLSFFIADIFTLSYHLETSKDGFFIFHGIAYSLLFLLVIKSIIRNRWSRFQKNYVLVTSALSFALLLFFGFNFQREIHGVRHIILFYFHGLAIIACLSSALSYYERKADFSSMLFLFAVLGFIFSDLTAFAAEYLKADKFYYFSRIFYVTGIAGLLRFSFFYKPIPTSTTDTEFPPYPVEQKAQTAYHEH